METREQIIGTCIKYLMNHCDFSLEFNYIEEAMQDEDAEVRMCHNTLYKQAKMNNLDPQSVYDTISEIENRTFCEKDEQGIISAIPTFTEVGELILPNCCIAQLYDEMVERNRKMARQGIVYQAK